MARKMYLEFAYYWTLTMDSVFSFMPGKYKQGGDLTNAIIFVLFNVFKYFAAVIITRTAF